MKLCKKLISSFLFALCLCSTSFSADLGGLSIPESADTVPIQERYDALSEVVPSYIMLQSDGTGNISQEVLEAISDKLNREMVYTEKLKPVSLDKWLIGKYGLEKEVSIDNFIAALADERYPINVTGVCKPYVFQNSEGYAITLSFYRFSDGGYPIIVFRNLKTLSECSYALRAMLNEYISIIEEKTYTLYQKKKVIVKPFLLESRKYIGQTGGDFDYIPSTFIEQDGVTIRTTDDYFSKMLAYSLYSTEMVNAMAANNITEYVNQDFNNYNSADFYIEGRVQLTDQINIFHISLFDAKTKSFIQEVKFFSSDFSLSGLINVYHNIIYSLAENIFGKGNYGVAPDISAPGQGFYLNHIFLGWDSLSKVVLPRGKHIVYTGSYYRQDSNYEVSNKNKATDINGNLYRSFFLFLDERNWLFRGKDGERVWNLLEK
ncbi:MAG: hypothetical protein MJ185_03780 [Treponema sp.]|nr:hypothetical protein [Treponema sp.]